MSTVFIYALKCPTTGEIRYVGKATNPMLRLRTHLQEAKRGKNHRAYWIRSLAIKGMQPKMEIVDEVPENEWQSWEVAYIQHFREEGFDLVNGSLGGDGNPGLKHSAEAREKIRDARLGAVASAETCAKIGAAHSGIKHPNFGKPAYNRGCPASLESRRKQSLVRTGKRTSPETRKRMALAQLCRYERPWIQIMKDTYANAA